MREDYEIIERSGFSSSVASSTTLRRSRSSLSARHSAFTADSRDITIEKRAAIGLIIEGGAKTKTAGTALRRRAGRKMEEKGMDLEDSFSLNLLNFEFNLNKRNI